MKRRMYFFLMILVLGCNTNAASPTVNYLNKVFHHKGKISDKIACYFSRDPLLNHIPEKPVVQRDNWQTLRFFFPMAVVGTAECKQMLEQLNASENKWYSMQFESVNKPIKGLALVVRYETTKIGFEYESFTSIQQQPGVVFKFYDKNLLNEINQESNPLQYYACNKQKVHVVIDNGHGGDDEGKIGCFNIKEKDINLLVGMKVAKLLRKQGYLVSLTRNVDRFVPLGERTAFANTVAKADIFVSIHSNGAPSANASGIETFCSQQSLFSRGFSKNIDDSSMQLIKKLEMARYEKSHVLADHVHAHTLALARKKNEKVPDRKVKTAISQVLLGTDMPCALIEIGFLSNEHEARLLNSPEYQASIAQGICNGINAYVQHHLV